MTRFLIICALSGALAMGCSGSSQSGGPVMDGTTGGTGGTIGSSSGGSGTGGGQSCRNIECLRAYECVSQCGSDQVINNGCCPCPTGTVDILSCPDLTITQGIWGEVLWLEGNHMPGSAGGTTRPLSREVRIYEPVNQSDAVVAMNRAEAYGVYSAINGTLVKTTSSNSAGFYEVALEPGTYSVFVEDEADWYCNLIAADGLCTVTVTANAAAPFTIRIDYAAAY